MPKKKHKLDKREQEIAASLRRRCVGINPAHLPNFLQPERRAKWYRQTELYYEKLALEDQQKGKSDGSTD